MKLLRKAAVISLAMMIGSRATAEAIAGSGGMKHIIRGFIEGHIIIGNVRIPNLMWIIPAMIISYLILIGLVCLIFRPMKEEDDDIPMPVPENFSHTWRTAEINRCVDIQIHYDREARQVRHEITREFTIGRKGCSLNLDKRDHRVAKKHCKLVFVGNMLKLEDTSSGGTRVNEQLIRRQSYELHSGDRIQIGGHLLVIRY